MDPIYARSLEGKPPSEWQTLREHSVNVAHLASAFAKAFNSCSWLQAGGSLHDVGKARKAFKAYLLKSNGLQDQEYDSMEHGHSGPSAVWAQNKYYGKAGLILAYLIAGHHAGLPDYNGGMTPNGSLVKRLETDKAAALEEEVVSWIEQNRDLCLGHCLTPPWKFRDSEVHFWIRMMFSCLVDADCLDAEEFTNPEQAELRRSMPQLDSLETPFFKQLYLMQDKAEKTPLNAIRAAILSACEQAAILPPGMFSLTVPTGGGKTLSGTAFAFRHALKYGLKRIIYVIPYTSIIEQTADVLRKFLGAENVVEHHSNFSPEKETQQSRLATENWDAPVIVTTNVQFFESLYACKSSRCRKLHNIAQSVVILDEAQLLPPRLLLPCVEAMQQLVRNYGTSIVLSTATQPALPGLDNVREIIPETMDLYGKLKRTQLILPETRTIRQSWEEIAKELQEYDQVLCIVNTRRDCRDLYELIPTGTIHLSATMCGEHRSRVIADIKERLKAGQPVRVISTQLVEAGVDIDFPVVYRAFTGLSSIAQAAGRCNREGLLSQLGRVVVFMPPKPAPPGELRKAEDVLTGLLENGVNVESPDSYPEFFSRFYSAQNDLGTAFKDWLTKDARDFHFQFREAAQAFKIIDDQESASVIVRYGDNDALLRSLYAVGPKRDIMRRLQRYTVNVPRRTLAGMRIKGFVEEPHPGIFVQTQLPSLYNENYGLDLYRDDLPPEDLQL